MGNDKQPVKRRNKVNAQETLAMLNNHPLTQQLKSQRAAEILKEREEAALRLEAIKEETEAILPGIQTELLNLQNELKRHDQARKVIQSKQSAAALALATEKQRIERERREAETVLFETCDPRIDEAITFFRDKREALLLKKVDRQIREGKRNIFTMQQEIHAYSNVVSIRAALFYSLSAIAELEKSKLQPVLNTERIDELKHLIPNADELTEVVGNKAIPAGAESVNALHLLPSPDEMNWKIGKLTKRVEKILRK